MRKQDIKVGQRLAHRAWKHAAGREVEVVEIDASAKTKTWPYSSVSGTLVRFVGQDKERVVANRELFDTWEHYSEAERVAKQQRLEREAAKKAATQDRLLRAKDTHDALSAAGFPAHKVQVFERHIDAFESAGFEVTRDDMGSLKRGWITTPLLNLTDFVEYGKTLSLNAEVVADHLTREVTA